ncbi:cytochrome c oxidase subunit 2A [Paenibacillus athensensis]|uniref:cytochrome c oxidase subunit 2A n=1 Tax=Paenibacillus athensensis TaxID=1967502 RepID=UPI00106F8118|nr:cytochrome c oxidase subunit 2A [Paenibacillus athensensis]MCD1261017.1 cytochrome c oxidase subunit 2A [Paenibacillus athensensis]
MSKRGAEGRAGAADGQRGEVEPSLRGTFAAVLLLGVFVAVTWVAVFVLFMARQ